MTFDEWIKTQMLPPDLKDWPPHFEAAMRFVWDAARTEQREEDAAACERISDEYQEREGRKYAELRTDAECGARECADAIRAGGGK